MAVSYAIEDLFDAVKTTHTENARNALEEARKECVILKNVEHINRIGKESLKSIEEIIRHVSKGELTDAKTKYKKAETGFKGHLKKYLEIKKKKISEVEALSKDTPKGTCSQTQGKGSKRQQLLGSNTHCQNPPESTKQTSPRLESNKSDHDGPDQLSDLKLIEQAKTKTTSTNENKARSEAVKSFEDISKTERSKRASLKLRQNNPDIADLSDINRPTKIAERFSELYDNEWTEAFEELSKKSRSETETIEFLLTVVKEAYKFCTNAAESQIKNITQVFGRIIEFGPDDFNNKTLISKSDARSEEGNSLVIQYRKEIADLAIHHLKQVFMKSKLQKWKKESSLPTHLGALDLYVEKAVELTWWMCVQDPPIYLCPTTSTEKDGFDLKTLYKAYTKSGSKPDFFVWPALKLHKEGGVLMKGVVQFK